MHFFSANPAKRATEIFVLAYTPFWIAVVGAVMLTRVMAGWSDVEHLALGLGLALPLWLVPLARPFAADRDVPVAERHVIRYAALIALVTFVQCYFGSALFFDRLGMEYHFHVRWILNRTPVFLYFLTLAYFSTYYVVMSLGWRALASLLPESRWSSLIARAVLSYSVAFGETFFMATDGMREFFSYRDRHFALLWGSLCYGTLFFVTLPLFADLDEDPAAPRRPMRKLARDALALNMLALILYEVCANWIQLKR